MAVHWKKQLGDAYAQNRKLKSRIHALEQALKEADAERAAAVAEAALSQKRQLDLAERLARAEAQDAMRGVARRRPLSEIELHALSVYSLIEDQPSTPARLRLIEELKYRGILLGDGAA
jgi:hypothetical protein